jgi:hypothetical protein
MEYHHQNCQNYSLAEVQLVAAELADVEVVSNLG